MSLYAQVQDQMRSSFQFLSDKYSTGLLEHVLRPDQVIEMPLTIMMDDGSTKTFTAYRSQHNNIKGPYKGGLRFHPNVSKDEVMSLSARMSLKTSVVGLPLGGGKGGIIVDPKKLSDVERERLSRAFMRKLAKHIGPEIDIPAPDVNTDGQVMARMIDEYCTLKGKQERGTITGKPLEIGGSQGRTEATSLGGLMVLQEYLRLHSDDIQNKTIAIQGAGNVGLHFAQFADQHGAKVVAISDSKGGVYDPDGLNIAEISQLKAFKTSVTKYGKGEQLSSNEILELDVDILVPAALENVITKDNADNIHAPIILELANGPVSFEADEILSDHSCVVIPDVLANAGGVTVSYFEQTQNNMNFYRSKEEVNQKLSTIMIRATQEVVAMAKHHTTDLRNGSYIIALDRILGALDKRGR